MLEDAVELHTFTKGKWRPRPVARAVLKCCDSETRAYYCKYLVGFSIILAGATAGAFFALGSADGSTFNNNTNSAAQSYANLPETAGHQTYVGALIGGAASTVVVGLGAVFYRKYCAVREAAAEEAPLISSIN